MARWLGTLVGLGTIALLVGACFGPVLVSGEQFGFRDSAHYYYPLHRVVQDEWEAGRIPLWDPWENAGMPLLGNPTAAVLYPGKLVFAVARFDWATRLYTIGHVLLAAGGAYALMRQWGTSRWGALIAAIGYGFGVPVLFQYCNIIYLVGAAWVPWGLRAVDRVVRERKPGAVVELAVVLALQVLGGDPQAAYLVGLAAGLYLIKLRSWSREEDARGSRGLVWLLAIVAVAAWVVLALLAARFLPLLRPRATPTIPMPVFPWTTWIGGVVAGVWGVIALGLAWAWRRTDEGTWRLRTVGLLGGAAVLAALLSAAQLLPVTEYTSRTLRAAREGAHDIYPFSLEPYRLVELVWPTVFGITFREEHNWMNLLPPAGRQKMWVPSLYLGGLVVVMALAARGKGAESPGARWLKWLTVLAIVGAFGEFGSPVWAARYVPAIAEEIGPHDSPDVAVVRKDGKLRDGEGGVYWAMATFLPGFDQFRYSSKLFTFAAIGLAGLAAFGWDRVMAGESRRALRIAIGLLAVTLLVLVGVLVGRESILGWFRASDVTRLGTGFGPMKPEGAYREIVGALGHGAVVLAACVGLILLAKRRPGLAGPAAVILMGLDLAMVAPRFVLTVPQSYFDEAEPKVVAEIAKAEAKEPFGGPYRVHRMAAWEPALWVLSSSPNRVREFVEWEHDTIQPKYGLLHDVHYTLTEGVAELYDYWFFFGPFMRTLRGDLARNLNAEPGTQAVYFPRRGFDLWNTRYFVVPILRPRGWEDERRSYASFLPGSTLLYPDAEADRGLTQTQKDERLGGEDLQILRNEQAFPRTWIVHSIRFLPPIEGMRKADRVNPMYEILYPRDAFWTDATLEYYDPRQVAWVETYDQGALAGYTGGGPTDSGESVTVDLMEPQRVELTATLTRPGVVVLADVNYPGWELTVDGKPAEILRTNRLMRGVALQAGTFKLVYTYRPRSFRVGLVLSGAGLAISAVLLGRAWRRRNRSTDQGLGT